MGLLVLLVGQPAFGTTHMCEVLRSFTPLLDRSWMSQSCGDDRPGMDLFPPCCATTTAIKIVGVARLEIDDNHAGQPIPEPLM
jgi:hypothetical protein